MNGKKEQTPLQPLLSRFFLMYLSLHDTKKHRLNKRLGCLLKQTSSKTKTTIIIDNKNAQKPTHTQPYITTHTLSMHHNNNSTFISENITVFLLTPLNSHFVWLRHHR
eukprot:m.268872 g.268872  ORF g.268872 m.268872 type:complete len:108 (+) comp39269_c0_seq1:13-336(+)